MGVWLRGNPHVLAFNLHPDVVGWKKTVSAPLRKAYSAATQQKVAGSVSLTDSWVKAPAALQPSVIHDWKWKDGSC